MSYERELKFAILLARQASEIMKKHFSHTIVTDWKSDSTPLTIADTMINDLVIHQVSSNFPQDSVLGEERSRHVDGKRLWVLDPIDGTMPYSNGIPTSCFALALVFEGQPVVATVFDLATDRVYSASKGKGAYLNDRLIKVNQQSVLGPKTFVNVDGRNELGGYEANQIISLLMKKDVRVTKSYSAVFNSMPVAYGRQAVNIGTIEYPWDGVAQALIVEEAGGRASDLAGNKRQWDREGLGFVVSNGVIHDKIINLIQQAR